MFGPVELEMGPSGVSGDHTGIAFRGLSQSDRGRPNSTSVGVEIIPQVDRLPRRRAAGKGQTRGRPTFIFSCEDEPIIYCAMVCIAAVHIY